MKDFPNGKIIEDPNLSYQTMVWQPPNYVLIFEQLKPIHPQFSKEFQVLPFWP
jgi:hypothetical protein